MTRSRSVVLLSSLVVVAGTLAAMGALYLSPARAAVGPLPAEGLVLPADTRFVVGIDVRRLVASELYAKEAGRRSLRPEAFAELEARTGLNPERDVDQVVIAGGPSAGTGPHGAGLVLVSGRSNPVAASILRHDVLKIHLPLIFKDRELLSTLHRVR